MIFHYRVVLLCKVFRGSCFNCWQRRLEWLYEKTCSVRSSAKIVNSLILGKQATCFQGCLQTQRRLKTPYHLKFQFLSNQCFTSWSSLWCSSSSRGKWLYSPLLSCFQPFVLVPYTAASCGESWRTFPMGKPKPAMLLRRPSQTLEPWKLSPQRTVSAWPTKWKTTTSIAKLPARQWVTVPFHSSCNL